MKSEFKFKMTTERNCGKIVKKKLPHFINWNMKKRIKYEEEKGLS
jgi:hypothetical protein